MLRSVISLVLCALLATSPTFAAGYTRFHPSLIAKLYGHTIARPGQGPVRAPGAITERFEVRAGDCAANKDWNDCDNDRERAEMSESITTQNQMNTEGWFAYSVFIPAGHPNIYPTKTALGQFHQRGGREPPVQFQIGETRNGFSGFYVEMTQIRGGQFPLVAATDLTGRWIDVLVHARWSKGDDGFLRVYVNGELRAKHEGATTVNFGDVYFKYGIYRSFVSRYQNMYHRPVPTQIVFYSWIKKGDTREEVEPPRR